MSKEKHSKTKVLIRKGLPPVLVVDGNHYATQSYKGKWWFGNKLEKS